MIDVHCHLQLCAGTTFQELIRPLKTGEIRGLVLAGQDLESSLAGIELARKYPGLWASIGWHPWKIDSQTITQLPEILMGLERLSKYSRVLAFSEVGLDYINCKPDTWELQAKALRSQLVLAARLNLPVVLHCRGAFQDLIRLVKGLPARPPRLAIHGFSGQEDEADLYLEEGFYLSFGVALLGEDSRLRKSLLRRVHLEKILFDSDATGKPGRPVPADLIEVARIVGVSKGLAEGQIAAVEGSNAETFFGLKF